MRMSDRIEAFILQLLNDEDDWIELKRNELALAFNCVPSQINYVLDTRFSALNGYVIESRRGGGGYLRIRRINKDNCLTNYILSIGDTIDFNSAISLLTSLHSSNNISQKEFDLLSAIVSDRSIPVNQPYRNRVRAEILKTALAKINESEGANRV